jgi:signal transduction histidine kinase
MTMPADDQAVLLARETYLADLGELAGPLTHEFNNLLNNLTLHLEIMKQKAPNNMSADLERIRRQVGQTASEIARFQRYRRAKSTSEESVDLNRVARQIVELLLQSPPEQTNGLPLSVKSQESEKATAGAVVLSLELENELPAVHGYAADLRRLCRFLLNNAVRATAMRGGKVQARTARQGNSAQFVVEDEGPDVSESALSRVFEPGQDCREGMCGLELAACRSIMRRLRGHLEARTRPNGGLIMVAAFAE